MSLIKYFVISIGIVVSVNGFSQSKDDAFSLSLDDVITLACDSSLEMFIAQNRYLADYWVYKNYKAGKLPFLSLTTTVADFNRSVSQEFSFADSSYHYIDQQTLNSYVNLSLSQNITQTGGKIFIDSDIGRLQNLKENQPVQYSSTIIRVGLEQQLFGYNSFKWDNLINPLLFEKSKKEYLRTTENISIMAIEYFFALASAQIELEISEKKMADADTLLNLGEKRFKIASISREDLYSLKLDLINSKNNLKISKQNIARAQMQLNSFLRLSADVNIKLILPTELYSLKIDPIQALQLARDNNPEYIDHRTRLLEADRFINQSKAESRFNANIRASYGLNRTADRIEWIYQSPQDQEMVALTLQVPILDWGLAKGKYNLALRQKESLVLQLQQAEIDIEQNIILSTKEFNIQNELVIGAAQADTIAQMAYEINKRMFMTGKVDILKISAAQNSSIMAKQNYITSLKNYWKHHYTIRKLTLYDFVQNKSLSKNFDELMNIVD